jgi:hypothetical protein
MEEYCWAITQAAERSYRGRSGSNVPDLEFQKDTLVSTYIVNHGRDKYRAFVNTAISFSSPKIKVNFFPS